MNPAAFDAMVNKMGQRVHWRRATDCPCRDARSGAADRSCPFCHGLGHLWADPVESQVGVAGQRTQQEWARFGIWQSGDQVVTLPTDTPAFMMGQNDRLTMLDSTVAFSVVVRPDGLLRETVAYLDTAQALVDGDLVSLTPPSVGDDGALSWASPPEADMVSLSGRYHPEYFAFQEYPQDRAHFSGTLFPRRVVLRKFDLFGR